MRGSIRSSRAAKIHSVYTNADMVMATNSPKSSQYQIQATIDRTNEKALERSYTQSPQQTVEDGPRDVSPVLEREKSPYSPVSLKSRLSPTSQKSQNTQKSPGSKNQDINDDQEGKSININIPQVLSNDTTHARLNPA